LASGIEAIFAFSIVLLQKNEDELLTLKFDDILAFLKNKIFDRYKVYRVILLLHSVSQ
jgi:tRNA splicing endonuclease